MGEYSTQGAGVPPGCAYGTVLLTPAVGRPEGTHLFPLLQVLESHPLVYRQSVWSSCRGCSETFLVFGRVRAGRAWSGARRGLPRDGGNTAQGRGQRCAEVRRDHEGSLLLAGGRRRWAGAVTAFPARCLPDLLLLWSWLLLVFAYVWGS